MATKLITIKVNETEHEVMVKPHTRLVSVLRDSLGLTGVRTGCRQGACGSCTVLVDDEVVLACLVLAIRVEGKSVITIEGLKNGSELDSLQQAFVDNNATQCGFCTSGMIMAAKSLLDHNPNPDKEEIHAAISGNVCRCTGYGPIVQAIQSTAEKMALASNDEGAE